jgi:hypothetical protein
VSDDVDKQLDEIDDMNRRISKREIDGLARRILEQKIAEEKANTAKIRRIVREELTKMLTSLGVTARHFDQELVTDDDRVESIALQAFNDVIIAEANRMLHSDICAKRNLRIVNPVCDCGFETNKENS